MLTLKVQHGRMKNLSRLEMKTSYHKDLNLLIQIHVRLEKQKMANNDGFVEVRHEHTKDKEYVHVA